jgi:hypothetical protein
MVIVFFIQMVIVFLDPNGDHFLKANGDHHQIRSNSPMDPTQVVRRA